MNYYLIDDDIATVKTLQKIIEIRELGKVSGYATDPEIALKQILMLKPQIVIVDLLMSKMDGITLVNKIKKQSPEICFIMLSKVKEKEMIAHAYSAGVEFFINKPINIIEVESVLKKVADNISMSAIVNNIRGMFENNENSTKTSGNNNSTKEHGSHQIKLFLGALGMLGEKGTTDILNVCQFLIENNGEYSKEVLDIVANEKGESRNNIEQHMRRAIKKGLHHVAHIAIDDYGNEVVQLYANYVFDFKMIRDEMDSITGKNYGGGRINVAKFISGLLLYQSEMEN